MRFSSCASVGASALTAPATVSSVVRTASSAQPCSLAACESAMRRSVGANEARHRPRSAGIPDTVCSVARTPMMCRAQSRASTRSQTARAIRGSRTVRVWARGRSRVIVMLFDAGADAAIRANSSAMASGVASDGADIFCHFVSEIPSSSRHISVRIPSSTDNPNEACALD